MAIIDNVKTALRLKSDAFDTNEIMPLILAARKDMERVGIIYSDSDPLCIQATVLYCKANFGYSDDSEKFEAAYIALRNSISLSTSYTVAGGVAGV